MSYAPDALGWPTQVSPTAGGVSHHPSGQVSRIAYINGVVTDVGFNARYWPASVSTRNGAGGLILNSSYGYDGAGNLASITDTVDGYLNRTLGYDDLDRLVQADAPFVWGSGAIGYNGWGNVLSQSLGSAGALTYSYDAANRLASVSGTVPYTLSYDAYGNVVNNGSFAFSYDDASNMTCANCAAATKSDYTYDGKRMRVRTVKNGVSTYSFYAANGNLLFELSGGLYTDYVYLRDKRLATNSSGGNTYFHNDLLGSPIAATDAAGNLGPRENYFPWGRQVLLGGTTSNTLWYAGKSHDWDTKLSYFGARYYDVTLGRFMGVDPQEFDEANLHSFNRYAYGNNNPYKFKDPSGEVAETILDVVSLGLSIAAFKSDPTLLNGLAVAYDAVATATPFLPAGAGILKNAGKTIDALGDVAKAERTTERAGDGAKTVPHGNRVDDRPATLYEKYGKDGAFQKHGVTKHEDPTRRYTSKEIDGGTVVATGRGPRREMIRKERELVETNPGPQNREPWAGRRRGVE